MNREQHTPESEMRQDNQLVQQIEALSRVKREDLPGGTTKLETPEGKHYSAARLENPKDPRVKASHDLLKQTFSPSEVDSLRTTRTAMEGKVVGDEETADTPLLVHTIENDKSEVAATGHTAVLENLNEDFAGDGKSALMLDGYTAVRNKDRGQQLGLELYRKRIIDAQAHAAERGLKMESVVAEVEPTGPEHFYNQVGLKRCYFENNNGELVEVPYFQSVLADAWDTKTGKAQPGQEKSALHLMIAQLDNRTEISAEELLSKVRALMDYDSFQTEGYFDNKKAYRQHEKTLKKDLAQLEKALAQAKGGVIKLMTAEERQQAGQKIVEHIKPEKK